MYCFIHNRFVPIEEATLHISDLAVQRGYGIFDFFRIRNNVPLFLNDHLDRFYRSAEKLRLLCPESREQLLQVIEELMKRNQLPDSGIKIMLTGGYSTDAYTIQSPNLIVTQHLFSYPADGIIHKGVKLITHAYRKEVPEVKSINYLCGIIVQQKVQQEEAFDALYHEGGIISEMPRNNFFIVNEQGEIHTPVENILYGITRKQVLALAAEHYTVKETTVTIDDLTHAREAFFTSTMKRIVPVVNIDGLKIGKGVPGPVTQHLLQLLLAKEQSLLTH